MLKLYEESSGVGIWKRKKNFQGTSKWKTGLDFERDITMRGPSFLRGVTYRVFFFFLFTSLVIIIISYTVY